MRPAFNNSYLCCCFGLVQRQRMGFLRINVKMKERHTIPRLVGCWRRVQSSEVRGQERFLNYFVAQLFFYANMLSVLA